MSLTSSTQWQALEDHFEQTKHLQMRQLFMDDPKRGQRFCLQAGDIYADFSKNRITDHTMELLFQLAEARKVEQLRDAMFAGEKINTTENRSVLHTALRNQAKENITVDGHDVMPQVQAVLDKMSVFAESVRSGQWKG